MAMTPQSRSSAGGRRDARRPTTRLSPWLFLLVPILLAVATFGLAVAGAAVGSALLLVFIYSFVIMTPIAVYACLREIWQRSHR